MQTIQPFLIKRQPSKIALSLLLGLGFWVAYAFYWKWLVWFNVVLLLGFILLALKYENWVFASSLTTLGIDAKGQLFEKQITTTIYKVEPKTLIFRYLIVLIGRCACSGQKKTWLIWSDSVEPEVYRQLRVYLRWHPNNLSSDDSVKNTSA